MKIVVATSIYPPEIGGPAYYAASLKESLEKQGHTVDVALYGALKKFPSGIRQALYTARLLARSRRADAIIAFDTFATGLPAALVHMLTGVPAVVRIGGDFVWELYIERTRDLLPLPEMYRHRERWSAKEKLAYSVTRFVLRRTHVVFSSAWQLEIWRSAYGLDPKRAHVIENAIEPRLEPAAPTRKNFIFYTRQIALKNAEAFNRAFAKAQEKYPDIELDEGMVPHAELLKRMRACYAVVLPSISDITPNYIIDAIRCGKPFLLTKYSGYAERFGQYGVIIDPLEEADMARGVERLADPTEYEKLRARIATFNELHTYDDIAREFVAAIQEHI